METLKAVCKICGQDGVITKIAMPYNDDRGKDLQLFDAVYCNNCGHGVFDLNELDVTINNFNKLD